MSETLNITPTSTLTPADLLPQGGEVSNFKDRPFVLDPSQNFKRLGSFWARQLAPEQRSHAKALSLTGLTTNSLTNVQNVKNNFANDSENLYFNSMLLPLEGLLKVKLENVYDEKEVSLPPEDFATKLLDEGSWAKDSYTTNGDAPEKTAFTVQSKDGSSNTLTDEVYVWKLSKDIILNKITSVYGEFIRDEHFYQFGRWVFLAKHIGEVGCDSATDPDVKSTCAIKELFKENLFTAGAATPLCSGQYPVNSYFGQSFYKPLLNIEYLPAGPGAKFVADYISGKNQNLVSLEVMLNTLLGLEASIGRNVSTYDEENISEIDPTDYHPSIHKKLLKLTDKITDQDYTLPFYSETPEFTSSCLVPANSFAQYLVKLYAYNNGALKRVALHSDDVLTIDSLTEDSIKAKGNSDTTITDTDNKLTTLIAGNFSATVVVHFGLLNDWENYHKYMSDQSEYFKSHFPTFQSMINYIIRIVKDHLPITYVPLFTYTNEEDKVTNYNEDKVINYTSKS